jgi:hypothetical protein
MSAVTMEELELETAELLPARETLYCHKPPCQAPPPCHYTPPPCQAPPPCHYTPPPCHYTPPPCSPLVGVGVRVSADLSL